MTRWIIKSKSILNKLWNVMIICLKIIDIKRFIKSKLRSKPLISSILEILLLLWSTFIGKISILLLSKIILERLLNLFRTFKSSSRQFKGQKSPNLILKIIIIVKSSLQLKKDRNSLKKIFFLMSQQTYKQSQHSKDILNHKKFLKICLPFKLKISNKYPKKKTKNKWTQFNKKFPNPKSKMMNSNNHKVTVKNQNQNNRIKTNKSLITIFKR